MRLADGRAIGIVVKGADEHIVARQRHGNTELVFGRHGRVVEGLQATTWSAQATTFLFALPDFAFLNSEITLVSSTL